MTHGLPFAVPIITTALNVAGIFAVVHLWLSYRGGARLRLAGLLPILIACAALEAAFVTHRLWLDHDNGVALSDVARRSGLDLLIWPAIGLACYNFRRLLAKRTTSKPSSLHPNSTHAPASATPQSLEGAINRFIAAADGGEVAAIAATYAADFTCVRVADNGGFACLSGEQMLAFWGSPTKTGAGQKHALPTRSTTIHHAEIMGGTGLALLTRVKDFGHGWEPVFYTLLWQLESDRWRLVRELVHQRTVPVRL
jgi:hypothetical protein